MPVVNVRITKDGTTAEQKAQIVAEMTETLQSVLMGGRHLARRRVREATPAFLGVADPSPHRRGCRRRHRVRASSLTPSLSPRAARRLGAFFLSKGSDMSKRRGNGEGSIYQRADGLWCARVSLGSGVDGKRRRRAVYGRTKREVQNKLGELSHRARNGKLTDPTRITVEAYLDRWLDKSARLHVRASTLESYRSIVRLHIAPVIGGFPLQKLTALDIEALYASMEKVGKSPRMRQYTHAVLRRATRQSR